MKPLGELIDELYNKRSERLALEKQVNGLISEEQALKAEVIERLQSAALEGGKGQAATAAIMRKIKPRVIDWDAFGAYILDNRDIHFLQRRISETYWRDMIPEIGGNPPGVEDFELIDLSLTKISR